MPVTLVCSGGGSAFEWHSLVETSPQVGILSVGESFVSGGEEKTPLAGCAKIAPGDMIGFGQAPLAWILLSDGSLGDESDDSFVSNIGGGLMNDIIPRGIGSGDSRANCSRDTRKVDDPKILPFALLTPLDPAQSTPFLDV